MGEAKSTAELTIEDIQNQLNEEERFQLLSVNQPPKFIKGLRSCEARINEDFRFTVQGNHIDFYSLESPKVIERLSTRRLLPLSERRTGTESLLVQGRRDSGRIREISTSKGKSWHVPPRCAETRIYRSSEY